jgi:hypothetical protein
MNVQAKIATPNAIELLLKEAHARNKGEDFVSFLISQLKAASFRPEEMEHLVGSLRIAVQRILDTPDRGPASRCNFCGRPRDQLAALYVSGENAMCDECAIWVLDGVSRAPGQFHLRVAFTGFRIIASIGRFLHDLLPGNRVTSEL